MTNARYTPTARIAVTGGALSAAHADDFDPDTWYTWPQVEEFIAGAPVEIEMTATDNVPDQMAGEGINGLCYAHSAHAQMIDAEGDDDNWPVFMEWECREATSPCTAYADFAAAGFQGTWDTTRDFAIERAHTAFGIAPGGEIAPYIDYEAYAVTIYNRYGYDDYWFIDLPDGRVAVFQSR